MRTKVNCPLTSSYKVATTYATRCRQAVGSIRSEAQSHGQMPGRLQHNRQPMGAAQSDACNPRLFKISGVEVEGNWHRNEDRTSFQSEGSCSIFSSDHSHLMPHTDVHQETAREKPQVVLQRKLSKSSLTVVHAQYHSQGRPADRNPVRDRGSSIPGVPDAILRDLCHAASSASLSQAPM